MDGEAPAIRHVAGRSPGMVFLPGYASTMSGMKAQHLAAHISTRGRACTLLDYRGCGLSGGDFLQQTIGSWRQDALAAVDRAGPGPLVVVGSSMGGWLALLAAQDRPDKIRGLVLLAPAPDFPSCLILPRLDAARRARLEQDGIVDLPSRYGPPLPLTWRLVQESRSHEVLHGPIPLHLPIHIIQGRVDPDVPWTHAMRLAQLLPRAGVTLELVEDGDHRLSRPADLARMDAVVERMIENILREER